MTRNTFISIFGVLALLILITTGIFLYAQGYRLDFRQRTLTATGIILAKSLPEGAQVYLDGELTTATNSTLSGVKPGTYQVKIERDGYFPWEKNIEVKAGLVTEIIALLPPLSPSLTAVTQEGARLVTSAPSGVKAAFLSKNKLYLLSLTDQLFGFLRTSPQEIGSEPTGFSFAQASELLFSPNEDQIALSSQGKTILFDLDQPTPQTVNNPTELAAAWRETINDQKTKRIQQLGISEELKAQALSPSTLWSPDEEMFLYAKQEEPRLTWWVADATSNQKIWEADDTQLKLFWLADSKHFVMIENETVSLLDLDGSNKRDLFKGTLTETVSLSSADLSRIIILTSISPNAPANLYAISLR